jgi:predicted dehydrogenase
LNFRYQHCVTKAREMLVTGEIGRPRFGGYSYWWNRDGRAPDLNKFTVTMRQPMLYELTIHHIDAIRYVYGADVQRVTCRCSNPPWSMYQDDATVTAILELTGGVLVDYFGTWSGQTKVDQFLWRTDCDAGALFQYGLFSDLRVVRGAASDRMEEVPLPPQERQIDDTRAMLSHVLVQLLDGALHPEPSALDHLKTFAATCACEESSDTGRPIEIAEFLDRHGVPAAWR